MKNLIGMILLLSPALTFAQGQGGRGGMVNVSNQAHLLGDVDKFKFSLRAQWDETGFELFDRGIHTYEHLLSIDDSKARELADKLRIRLESIQSIIENRTQVALNLDGVLQMVVFNQHSIQIERRIWLKADDRQKNLITIHALMNESPGNYLLTMEIASLLAARELR